MIGTAASLMGYYLVLFILTVWMVVKIARSSPILAVGTFLFWPLSLLALFKFWGDRDSDVRIPFFASVLTMGLMMHMAGRLEDKLYEEGAIYMTESDLVAIAEEDPALAAKLRTARDEARAKDDETGIDWEAYEASDGELSVDMIDNDLDAFFEELREDRARVSAERLEANVIVPKQQRRPAAPLRDRAGSEIDRAALEVELSRLAWRFASLPVEAAHTTLRLPSGFRFAPKFALSRIAQLRGTPLEPLSLGWVVHEKVDLAEPDAWYVEVLFIETGHMPMTSLTNTLESQLPTLEGRSLADDSGRTLGAGALAPQWNADSGVLTWAVHDDPFVVDARAELLAARPLRHGVLLFVVPALDSNRHELGLRASRLLAAKAEVEPRWQHHQFQPQQDLSAGLALLDWVAGRALPEPESGASAGGR